MKSILLSLCLVLTCVDGVMAQSATPQEILDRIYDQLKEYLTFSFLTLRSLSNILEMTSGKLEVSHGNEERVKDGLQGAG